MRRVRNEVIRSMLIAVIVLGMILSPGLAQKTLAAGGMISSIQLGDFPEPLKGEKAVTAGADGIRITQALYPNEADVEEVRWYENGMVKESPFSFAGGKKYYAEIIIKAENSSYFPADLEEFHYSMNGVSEEDDEIIVSKAVSGEHHEILTLTTREYKIADHFLLEFDMRGVGSPLPSQKVEPGAFAKEPAISAANGNLLEGWYSSLDFKSNEKHAFNSYPITKDTVLYAHWLPANTDIRIVMDGAPLLPVIGEPVRPEKDFQVLYGSPYKITDVHWYENGTEIHYPALFRKGKAYTLRIDLAGTEGFLFPEKMDDIQFIAIDDRPELVDKETYFASNNYTDMTASASIYSLNLPLKDSEGSLDTPVIPSDPDHPDEPEQPDDPKTPAQAAPPEGSGVKVGDIQKAGSCQYRVTKAASGKKKGQVSLKKARNAKKVTIPASVRLSDGRTYLVTSIGAKAFKGKKIRTVTIGKNVKKMARGSFSGSKAVKLILKTAGLKKSTVKGCLKKSRIKTIQIKAGKKSKNKKLVKKYKKFFTKKNCGRKVTVK